MSLKKSLLESEQQTKVVTNAGLGYFAQQFNSLVDTKIGAVAGDLEAHSHDDQYAGKEATESHIDNGEVHITAGERVKWDAYEGAIQSLHQLITGKSSVEVVANLEALTAIESPKVGDLVYVLSTEGHPEGGVDQALGFIYADINGEAGWHLFTDLEPSLHAKDLTVDMIAGLEGTTVQAVLESLAAKVVSEVERLEGEIARVEALVGAEKADLEGKIATVDGKIAQEVEDRVAGDNALQEAINTVDGKVETLAGTVTTEVERLDGEIAGLKTADETLQGTINTIQGEVDALKTRVEGTESDIEGIGTEITTIQGRLDTLEGQVGENIQDAIDALREELVGITDALNTRVTTLEGKVTTVEAKLDTVQEGAEVNQEAFSKIMVGGVEVVATEKTDTFELAVTEGLLIEATGKKVTVSIDPITTVEIDDIIASLAPSGR